MQTNRRYLPMFLAAVSVLVLGAGCFRVGPRVVQAPEKPGTIQVAGDTGKTRKPDSRYEASSSSTAMAYLKLNGGEADVTRGGIKVAGEDGLELASGDRLTVASGTVFVVYPDSGASQLESGTDLVLSVDESKPGMVMQLELVAGRVWTRFERLFGKEEYYAVSSNGVVATVRGTAFGVSADDGVVDVQVADHDVEVTTESGGPSQWRPEKIMRALKISAGEGLKIATRGALPDIQLLKTSIRRLNVSERLTQGFKFGANKLLPERLRKPANPLRLKIQPIMSPDLQSYQDILLRRAAFFMQATSTFVAPTRLPTLQETTAPTSTPTIKGPSS